MSDDSVLYLRPLPSDDDALIPSRQMPGHIGISAQTLANWRNAGKGPKYIKIGRMVAYRVGTVRDWLAKQQRSNT